MAQIGKLVIFPGDTVEISGTRGHNETGVVTYADTDNDKGQGPYWMIELKGGNYWKQRFDGGKVKRTKKGPNHKRR